MLDDLPISKIISPSVNRELLTTLPCILNNGRVAKSFSRVHGVTFDKTTETSSFILDTFKFTSVH